MFIQPIRFPLLFRKCIGFLLRRAADILDFVGDWRVYFVGKFSKNFRSIFFIHKSKSEIIPNQCKQQAANHYDENSDYYFIIIPCAAVAVWIVLKLL